MKNISVEELNYMIERDEPFQLIDLRESYERDICKMAQSEHIPLDKLLSNLDKLDKDIPVILHCRTGDRARAATAALEQKHGFENLYNLEGGIIAWAERYDPSMEKY